MPVTLNAVQNDYSGDLLRRTTGLFSDGSAYTIACWIKLTGDNNRINVVWYTTHANGGTDFLATGTDGTTLYFTRLRDPVTGHTITVGALTPGVWYWVCVVNNGGATTVDVYLNNVLAGSTPTFNPSPRGNPTKFDVGGGDPDASAPFDGSIAYFRVWQTLFNSGARALEMASATYQFLFAIYADIPFASNANDTSGQAHHLTPRGTPTYGGSGPAINITASPPLIAATSPALFTTKMLKSGAQVADMPGPIGGPTLYAPILNKTHLRININRDAQYADYAFRGIPATRIELNYYPRVAYTGLLWQTKVADPTKVAAAGAKEIKVSPETAEGWKITASEVYPFGGGSTLSASGGYLPYITSEIHQEGQQVRLFFGSTAPGEATLTIALYGTGYYTKDKQTLIVRDDDLLEQNVYRHKPKKVDLSLVASETEAAAVASSLLDLLSHQIDGIFEIGFTFGDSENGGEYARRAKTVLVKPGSVVVLTEDQSMVSSLACLVLAEEFDSNGKELKITYKLLPIEIT